MDLRQLRAFETLAETGSFTRAARDLSVTQPAISAQTQALESELGVRLFERLPRRVLLTPAGHVLLDYARRLLNLESEARKVIAETAGAQGAPFRIGASPTIGEYLLPKILGEFKHRLPEVRVIVEIEATFRVVEALQVHAIDVGLVEAAVDAGELAIDTFGADELVLIVAPSHPWASRGSVGVTELAEQPIITREPGSGMREQVEGALAALGVPVKPSLELGGIEAIKSAVALGLGVSFVSRHAVLLDQEAGRLVVVPVGGLDLHRPLFCIRNRQRYLSPILRSFLDLVLGGEAGRGA